MLQILRESLGDAYLLACGAPILPALGLCDGLRIGPDVASNWASALDADTLYNFSTPGAQNAARTSLNRLWLKPLVHTDPDVVFFRSTGINLTREQKSSLDSEVPRTSRAGSPRTSARRYANSCRQLRPSCRLAGTGISSTGGRWILLHISACRQERSWRLEGSSALFRGAPTRRPYWHWHTAMKSICTAAG